MIEPGRCEFRSYTLIGCTVGDGVARDAAAFQHALEAVSGPTLLKLGGAYRFVEAPEMADTLERLLERLHELATSGAPLDRGDDYMGGFGSGAWLAHEVAVAALGPCPRCAASRPPVIRPGGDATAS